MFHLNEYKNRFRIPISEWNKLANFINNLAAGKGIKITKPDAPSSSAPPIISLESEEDDSGYTTDSERNVFSIKEFYTQNGEVVLTFQKMNFENGLLKSVEDFASGTVRMYSADL